MKEQHMTKTMIEGKCLNYVVYQQNKKDTWLVADVQFDKSIIERGDKYPVGLTTSEVSKMITDLVTLLRLMLEDDLVTLDQD
jgi:hypothetical protein